MEFTDVIKERYSVRSYSDRKIEEEKLEKILQAGILAPTAKNIQPQRIYVLESAEAVEKTRNLTPCTYGAPMVLLVCYDKNESWKNTASGEDSGVEDASIACTHIMLEAWNQGIGSCWVNMYNSNKVKAEFNLPENIVPVCMLPIGYASQDAKPNEIFHNSYKSKEEIYIKL
jgi:nitroreductase